MTPAELAKAILAEAEELAIERGLKVEAHREAFLIDSLRRELTHAFTRCPKYAAHRTSELKSRPSPT